MLTTRQRDILRLLLDAEGPLAAADLAQSMHLTPRQVSYGLQGLKQWLAQRQLTLKVTPGVGVELDCSAAENASLARELQTNTRVQLVLEPHQRQQLLALLLLDAGEPAILQQWEQLLDVSRTTVLADLDAIEGWLEGHHLRLERRPNYGIAVSGDEQWRRQALGGWVWGETPFGAPLTTLSHSKGVTFALAGDVHLLPIVRAAQVAALSDALLAERAADLRDVGQRVLRLLVGAEDGARLPTEPAIVVAHDLTPSDTAALSGLQVLGFCTAAGGPTAHAAIIARALRLPAVVSAGEAVLSLAEGTTAILDGSAGTLAVSPGEGALAMARARQKHWQQTQETAAASASQPAITADGHHVEVVANIGALDDARAAAAAGAEGVGLLRTEFLFLGRPDAPSEDEQAQVYRDIVAALEQRPVIVRTLDIGGDKPLPYIEVPPEANPFLGERGIRLCLARPELLRQQVRAILRAAEAGPVRIMFPMIADAGEWRRARQIVEEERAALGAPPVEMGIMIEIPSAALMADHFATEVDFFSVGTNDLTQYTLAMDRMPPTLASQSDGLHPAVLRLIARTVDAAHEHGKWVGICGELAADPLAVPILVGLGVDELSVSVPAVAAVKAQIRQLNLEAAQRRGAARPGLRHGARSACPGRVMNDKRSEN